MRLLLIGFLSVFFLLTNTGDGMASTNWEYKQWVMTEPTFLPVTTTNPTNRYVIHAIDLDEVRKKNLIQSFHENTLPIIQRFKVFTDNEDYCLPTVFVTPVEVEYLDAKARPRGWYDSAYNILVITVGAVDKGKDTFIGVYAHELGHWFWSNVLTAKDKEKYQSIIGEFNDNEIANAKFFYGDKQEYIVFERFAEDFRIYACEIKSIGEIKPVFEQSQGNPKELKSFFSRFLVQNSDRELIF